MTKYKNLFLQQSYNDQYDTYLLSLDNRVPIWDYIVLTASNAKQAIAYEQQISHRLSHGKLPSKTRYLVLPDPNGQRVGSGGATLNVMREVLKDYGVSDFSGLRILCIHSGGDSKRVSQYSACGKLFSPVPRVLPDGRRSTLFDECMIGMSGVPSRMTDGMLMYSGDVLLLFNPLQIDFYGKGAAAFSIKEHVDTAKNHGVYLADGDGNVGAFLHKQSEAHLREVGAVNEYDCCNIDTGAMIYDSTLLNDLYTLIDTPEKFDALVNDHVRLSLYADFSYPLASGSTLEQFYQEVPEGDFSPELTEARTKVWEVLHPYRMKLIRFSPAAFIHFGTTRELLRLMTDEMEEYCYLNWNSLVNTNVKDVPYAVSNSYINKSAVVSEGCYIEDSYLHSGARIGKGSIISGITLRDVSIPEGRVLHGLKLGDGTFIARYYGVYDNPKEAKHFGQDISEALWTAPLFPVCATMDEAVKEILALYDGSQEMGQGVYLSLQESFNQADVTAILPWQEKLDDRIKVKSFLVAIEAGVPMEETVDIFCQGISKRVVEALLQEAKELDEQVLEEFSMKTRIYRYLAHVIEKVCGKDAVHEYREMMDTCFGLICSTILKTSLPEEVYREDLRIQKDKVVTRLPVRVNFGGCWSDAPPYCLEQGGTSLNAAITLQGKCPIEATIQKLEKPVIALASSDVGVYKEFHSLEELQDCKNPSDIFALHKAALLICGVIPYKDKLDGSGEKYTLEGIMKQLGGGIYLNTRVINIPKGSGLGTSSILAAACVKGIYEFLGVEIEKTEIYNRVLCIEQMMSTGGGWQDQVGGLTPGIKMVTTEKGLFQSVKSTPLNISDATLEELNDRYALIYTGQRRLARNLLREVVGKYLGGSPDSKELIHENQKVAVLMRFELEKGNIDGFATLMNEQWELIQVLDKGCTNTCINQIFMSIEDLIVGKMICGAGGGGFLQVVVKQGVTADMLQERIKEVFADSGVVVWESRFC